MVKIARLAGQILNREELAGLLGVSTTAIDALIRAGCPVLEKGAGRRPYKFNSADVLAWRDRRHADAQVAGEPNADQAKRRHQLAAAELKELQLAEKRGLMISVEDVAPIIEDELANVRSRLMAMPGRLAPGLVGLLDPAAIEAKIRDEVAGALSEISAEFGRQV